MVGAPGVGKTLVALTLIRQTDFSGDRSGLKRSGVGSACRRRVLSHDRKAFFLVTTRALAEQQHERLGSLTSLDVALCVGMELDLWTKQEVKRMVFQTRYHAAERC
jgi:superfamily II DNA or RNA helicase